MLDSIHQRSRERSTTSFFELAVLVLELA
jgi:hypothetical protein